MKNIFFGKLFDYQYDTQFLARKLNRIEQKSFIKICLIRQKAIILHHVKTKNVEKSLHSSAGRAIDL